MMMEINLRRIGGVFLTADLPGPRFGDKAAGARGSVMESAGFERVTGGQAPAREDRRKSREALGKISPR